MEADLGGNEIRLFDTVTNAGFDRTPHVLLYHINLGWPLLDEGSRFIAPIGRTLFCTPSVAEQRVSYWRMPAPQPGFVEQVYGHALVADAAGHVTAALINDSLELGVAVEWSLDQLPGFAEWLHLREGGYALAIEPTSRTRGDRADPYGGMVWLEPGETRQYATRISVHTGAPAIERLVERIQRVARQTDADIPEIVG